MNNKLRTRAANLFAAEQRAQDLMGIALAQQSDYQTLDIASKHCTNLNDLAADSDLTIVNTHNHLHTAQQCAAKLQTEDKQLNALQRLIYNADNAETIDDNVIEGEFIESKKGNQSD
jgi:hypothetical protein